MIMPSQNDGTASPAMEITRIDVVDPGVAIERRQRAQRHREQHREDGRHDRDLERQLEPDADLVASPAARSTSTCRNRASRMPDHPVANCDISGWSSPSRVRSASIISCETLPPSPRSFTSTTSPGMRRSMKNTSTATPSSVGIISSRRLTM